MSTGLLLQKPFFTLLFAVCFATLSLSAQTAQPTASQPKKGKLTINQDAEISRIVYNKKTVAPAVPAPSTTTPSTPKTDKVAKTAETKNVDTKKTVSTPTDQRSQATPTTPEPKSIPAKEQPKEKKDHSKERAEEPERTYHVVRTRYKVRGFRIQIYTGGNTRNHKAQAHSVAGKARQAAPELGTYVQFQSPHWICRVGDFRNREDAQRYVKRLRAAGVSNEARIVSCEVLLAN